MTLRGTCQVPRHQQKPRTRHVVFFWFAIVDRGGRPFYLLTVNAINYVVLSRDRSARLNMQIGFRFRDRPKSFLPGSWQLYGFI